MCRNNDKLRHILLCAYVIGAKVVLFPTFLIVSVVHQFNVAMGHTHSKEPMALVSPSGFEAELIAKEGYRHYCHSL